MSNRSGGAALVCRCVGALLCLRVDADMSAQDRCVSVEHGASNFSRFLHGHGGVIIHEDGITTHRCFVP